VVEITIRPATPNDIPVLLRYREGMYRDMGYSDEAAIAKMISTSRIYLDEAMRNGSFRAWLAIVNHRPVAGAGLIINPWLSHPYDQQCRQATILNVYTDPQFRRKGIARRLMHTIIDSCREEGFTHVSLHASKDGRALYESLGFEPTSEMRLRLRS
jgi:ribosomal protein S18 acetylase RimI-like enzyme